jgi:nicotinate-nucleotide adenylyltransferase
MKPIGILGGTFDPIHFGHLRTAMELFECLRLEEVRFVPCRIPPHNKAPVAAAELRLEMTRVAVANRPGFSVDERELQRDGPSYSFDTLMSMRDEFPERSLCLIVGMDAFAGLTTWHRWAELLSLAHLVVAHRPGAAPPVDGELGRLLNQCRSRDPADLHTANAGRILLHSVTQLDISSSAIRLGIFRGESPAYLMPAQVAALIEARGCYAG